MPPARECFFTFETVELIKSVFSDGIGAAVQDKLFAVRAEVNKAEFEQEYGKEIDHSVFVCELVENGKTLSKNSFFFKPFKELKIAKPKVEFEITKEDSGFNIELKTDKLAKNVYFQIGDEQGFFTDNYFDLLPNEKAIINLKTSISEEKLKEVLTVRTLDGAF